MKNRIICVDFDGTCVKYAYPNIGEDIGAVPILKKLSENDKIILFTMRCNKELNDTIEWFKINNIPLFGINENPQQSTWTKSIKPYANLYIDDYGVGCPLIQDNPKPYVDWIKVEQILIEQEYIV